MTNQEFENIVSTTKPAVLAAIRRYLHEGYLDSIDDVAQEAYIRIYKHLQKNGLDSMDWSRLGNWAYTIAKNESIRFNSKNIAEFKKMDNLTQSADWKESIEFEDALLDRIEYEEVIREVPERYRELLIMLEKGMSGSEIAKALGIQPGTVKSRIHRMRSYIHEKFTIQ